jgi:hypothetical protein
MYNTKIRIRYASSSFAKSLQNALSADDEVTGGTIRVASTARGRILHVRVEGAYRIETLQATLQDIFRCIHAAETSLIKLVSVEL